VKAYHIGLNITDLFQDCEACDTCGKDLTTARDKGMCGKCGKFFCLEHLPDHKCAESATEEFTIAMQSQ
jgi:predicted amidophosphoribosyltransferase